jgi:malate synthase
MESWLRGAGCVPINHLMEDAATAEISRSQLWQWARHNSRTDKGKVITGQYLLALLDEETNKLKKNLGNKYASSKFEAAKQAFATNITGERYDDFLTTLLYDDIVSASSKARL